MWSYIPCGLLKTNMCTTVCVSHCLLSHIWQTWLIYVDHNTALFKRRLSGLCIRCWSPVPNFLGFLDAERSFVCVNSRPQIWQGVNFLQVKKKLLQSAVTRDEIAVESQRNILFRHAWWSKKKKKKKKSALCRDPVCPSSLI